MLHVYVCVGTCGLVNVCVYLSVLVRVCVCVCVCVCVLVYSHSRALIADVQLYINTVVLYMTLCYCIRICVAEIYYDNLIFAIFVILNALAKVKVGTYFWIHVFFVENIIKKLQICIFLLRGGLLVTYVHTL